MSVEFTYPENVTAYRDFLLREINRLHRLAATEIQQSRIYSPALLETKRRELLRQTQPLEDALVRLLSNSIWNVTLSS